MNKQIITENENYESDDYIISLVDIIEFLKESRHNVGWALLGTVGLAIVYLLSATPMYTASAVLIIHGKSQNTAILSNLDGPAPISDRHLQGQIEIIRSPSTSRRAVETTGIAKISPELAKDEVLSDQDKLNRMSRAVLKSVNIQVINLSNVIKLSVKWHDAKMAAILANAMAKSYTDDSSEDRINKAHQAQQWLDERITDIQTKLRSAALAIQERRSRRDYRLRASNKGKKIDRRKPSSKKSKLSLDELTSRKDTYKRIYESYLRAYTDSIHKQLYPKSSARIVSWATPSPFKSYPKTKIVLALSLILGVLIGLAYTQLRNIIEKDYSKRTENTH